MWFPSYGHIETHSIVMLAMESESIPQEVAELSMSRGRRMRVEHLQISTAPRPLHMLQHLVGDNDGELLVGAVLADIDVGEVDRAIVQAHHCPTAIPARRDLDHVGGLAVASLEKALSASIWRMRSQRLS